MQTEGRKGRTGTRTLLRRLLALALCIGIVGSAVPFAAAADGKERTYILRVDTGTNAGTQVLYLGIRYRDGSGRERTEFVFPHEHSLSDGYTGYSLNIQKRLNSVSSVTGYDLTSRPTAVDGLRANSSDYYILTTKYEIKTFLALDAFIRYPGGAAERTSKGWDCDGFFLFEAQKIYGLSMMGYYSDDYFLEFDGTLLARSIGARTINLMQSDTRERLTNIETCSEPYSNHSPAPYYIKMDIADIYGAGIEALATEVRDGRQLTGVAETLTYCIDYEDSFGMTRHTEIPVITSALSWAVEQSWLTGRLNIAGIAQQGESLIVPALLPDFRNLTGFTLFYGSDAAAEAGITAAEDERRTERLKQLSSDSLRVSGLTVYPPETTVRGAKNGALLDVEIPGKYTPLFCFTAPAASGVEIPVGWTTFRDGRLPEDASMLKLYTPGAVLTPPSSGCSYLIQIRTDTMDAAATTSDIQVQITYQAVGGTVKTAEGISLREAARNINGYWPMNEKAGEAGVDDASYLSAVSAGGTVAFTLQLNDVYAFQSVTFRMPSDSDDDWQMADFTIYSCSAISKRTAEWKDLTYSDRLYSRTYAGLGTKAVAKYPNDQELRNGNYVKVFLNGSDNTKTVHFSTQGTESGSTVDDDRPTLDWNEVRYSMTFREAQQDLGFIRRAETYTVNVNVASNNDSNRADGDCGSDNLFYFKLIFENGSSGYLLANQQLTADGFRAGMTETFTVLTNEDYGELVSVAIIPEMDSESDNQDPFDKLNIDSIEVVRQTTDGAAKTWRVSDVGWIGIDYVERGAEITAKGRPGRREGEVAQSQPVTSAGYSMNLLFTMTTGSYDRSASDVNYTPGAKNPAYKGSIVADIAYTDSNGIGRTVSVDVAAAIAQYTERKVNYYETTYLDQNQVTRKKAMVDPDYMLRENHKDSFIVTLQDVRKIDSVRFGLSSEVATRWKLRELCIDQIVSDGALQIDVNNNYIRTNSVEPLTRSSGAMGYDLQVFAPSRESETLGPQQTLTVTFGDHSIRMSDENGEWKPVISRVPESHNDTLNVFVQMEQGGTPVDKYPLLAAIQYENGLTRKPMQLSLDGFEADKDRAMFYALGVQVNGFSMLDTLKLSANSRSTVTAEVRTAVVQHLRSGVVIETYVINFGDNDIGANVATASLDPRSGEAAISTQKGAEKQTVKLFLSSDTAVQTLQPEVNDLVLAIRYTNEYDPTGTELVSAYRYLSDQPDAETGLPLYSKIGPGQILEIPFYEGAASEITGVSLAQVGSLDIGIESMAVAVSSAVDDTLLQWYDFANVDELRQTPRTFTRSVSNVVPVRMRFKTTQSAEIIGPDTDNGKEAPIRMTVLYQSRNGMEIKKLVVDDIRDYLVDGTFSCGEDTEKTATIELYMEDVSMIRSVTLEPYSTGRYSNAVWGLKSVYYEAQIDCETRSHLTECRCRILSGAPVTVNLCTVDTAFVADAFNPLTGVTTERQSDANGTASIAVRSGMRVIITPKITGQLDGYGFTAEALLRTGSADENVSCWSIDETTVIDEYGDEVFVPAVFFDVPVNETGSVQTYVVTIASEEVPTEKASLIIEVAAEEKTNRSEQKEDTTSTDTTGTSTDTEPTNTEPTTEPTNTEPTTEPSAEPTGTEPIDD